jgi:hypothetical protein
MRWNQRFGSARLPHGFLVVLIDLLGFGPFLSLPLHCVGQRFGVLAIPLFAASPAFAFSQSGR